MVDLRPASLFAATLSRSVKLWPRFRATFGLINLINAIACDDNGYDSNRGRRPAVGLAYPLERLGLARRREPVCGRGPGARCARQSGCRAARRRQAQAG